jgi:DNA-binding SARP family transcriptional activator/ABC-type transport system involved in cytochrome c biogenesis ATPase subunit
MRLGSGTPGVFHIQLLGRPAIFLGETELSSRIKYRKAFALLAYLVVHAGIAHRRERLADLLWPELEAVKARTNLRQALNNITAVLDRGACLRRDRDTLALELGGALRSDLELLGDAVLARLDGEPAQARAWREQELEPRLAMLGGEFFSGLELPDAPDFDDWVGTWRAHYRSRTVLLLAAVCRAQRADGRLGDAVASARRLVSLDVLDEEQAANLALLLGDAGDRQGALQAIDACADAARRFDPGAVPGQGLVALRERLARGPARHAPEVVGRAPELRWLAVMYCDAGLRHDDPRSENPATIEAVHAAAVLRGGIVVTASGRGFLVAFGLQGDAERCAARALFAASDIRRKLGESGARFRIGIGAGRALCRTENGVPHLAGELPDVAMRIGWTAEPGEVLVNDAVLRESVAGARLDPVGEYAFRGLEGVHRLFRLGDASAPDDAAARHGEPTFVGREREMAALRELWAAARAGATRTVLIRGGPGLGKTRLGREFAAWVASQGGLVRRIACHLENQQRTLAPVLDELALSAGAANHAGGTAARVLAFLRETAPDLPAEHAAVLAQAVDGAAVRDRASAGKDAVFAAILALTELRIAAGPTLLLVDDLHWADHATRELLLLLARWLQGRGALLLVTTRPQPDPELGEIGTTPMDLAPLAEQDVLALLRSAASAGAIPDDECGKIVAASGGVPLFAEHLARAWSEGSHHLLPIHELLQAELDLLGAGKSVLRSAAVLGERFDLDDLIVLMPDADVASELKRAAALGLIERGDAGWYAFRHALVRDAAYDGMPVGRRADLHRAAAKRLQARDDTRPEDVAQHLNAAGAWDEAAPWWLRAARGQIEEGYGADAMDSSRRAIEALSRGGFDMGDAAFQDARLCLGFAAQMVHGYGSELAHAEFGAVVAQLDGADLGDELRRAALFAAVGGLYTSGGSQNGLQAARRLHDLARTSAETLLASFALGDTLFWDGEFAVSLDWLRRGIALADCMDPGARSRYSVDDPAVTCRAFGAWALWFLGESDAAASMAAEAVALARRERRTHALCLALAMECGVHWLREDPQRVVAIGVETLELSRRYGYPMWEGASSLLLAWAQVVTGAMSDAAPVVGAARLLSSAYPAGVSASRWIAARTLVALGAVPEAQELLALAMHEARLHGDEYCMPDLIWLQGECLLQSGRAHEAGERFAAARELARARRALGLLARYQSCTLPADA